MPTALLKRDDIQAATVVIDIEIEPPGNVVSAVVKESSGLPEWDAAALDAMKNVNCRLGTPVTQRTFASRSFTLKLEPRGNVEPYVIKRPQPDTGSAINRRRITTDLPPFLGYAELSDAQKQSVKGDYESMARDDEPPYPLRGIGPLYRSIMDAVDRVGGRGELELHVRVDSTGAATSVSVFNSPNEDVTRAAGRIAMLTKYKPAVCAGLPCSMDYPIRLTITSRLR